MHKLDLKGNYAEQMLSMYLWGQMTPPAPDALADERFIRAPSATTSVGVDAREYTQTVITDSVLAHQKMFQYFFNNKTRESKGNPSEDVTLKMLNDAGGKHVGDEIILNHAQFVKVFYGGADKNIQIQAENAELNTYLYNLDTDKEGYWQRSFTFGSTKFKLDTESVEYVFDASTGKALRLDNVKVKPLDTFQAGGTENFDFESSHGIAKQINPILKQMMDPSGIGRKVEIKFIDNDFFELSAGSSYSQQDYRDYIFELSPEARNPRFYPKPDVPKTPSPNYSAFFNGLESLHASPVYDFLDDSGRVVVFGSNEADTISKFSAKNLTLDEDIDISSIDGYLGAKELAAGWLFDIDSMNKFRDHLDKGLVGGVSKSMLRG